MTFFLFRFSPGADSLGFDPQRFAMEYHIIGFRECASEVARYLVTIEGMDIQDPLRLRLMSHLQCFVAQRELSAKSSVAGASSTNWSNGYQPNYTAQSYQTYPGASPITPHQQTQQNSFNSSYMSASGSSSYLTPQSPEYSSSGYGTTSASSAANTSTANNASTTSPGPIQTPAGDQQQQQQQQPDSQQPIYTDLSNQNDRLLNLGGSYHSYGNNQLYGGATNNGYNNNNNNNSKPYRPWHPEMAY
jgi:hairy and enhancer of split related with YRPW motif